MLHPEAAWHQPAGGRGQAQTAPQGPDRGTASSVWHPSPPACRLPAARLIPESRDLSVHAFWQCCPASFKLLAMACFLAVLVATRIFSKRQANNNWSLQIHDEWGLQHVAGSARKLLFMQLEAWEQMCQRSKCRLRARDRQAEASPPKTWLGPGPPAPASAGPGHRHSCFSIGAEQGKPAAGRVMASTSHSCLRNTGCAVTVASHKTPCDLTGMLPPQCCAAALKTRQGSRAICA